MNSNTAPRQQHGPPRPLPKHTVNSGRCLVSSNKPFVRSHWVWECQKCHAWHHDDTKIPHSFPEECRGEGMTWHDRGEEAAAAYEESSQ